MRNDDFLQGAPGLRPVNEQLKEGQTRDWQGSRHRKGARGSLGRLIERPWRTKREAKEGGFLEKGGQAENGEFHETKRNCTAAQNTRAQWAIYAAGRLSTKTKDDWQKLYYYQKQKNLVTGMKGRGGLQAVFVLYP